MMNHSKMTILQKLFLILQPLKLMNWKESFYIFWIINYIFNRVIMLNITIFLELLLKYKY